MNFKEPLKMPRGSHYGSNYWEVFSRKMNRKACFFSDLEYQNFLTLEMNSNIEAMCEQPLEIEVMVDGKVGKSKFDFWVKYTDGTDEFQEIKYEEELNGDTKSSIRSKEQIRKQKLWCENNNIKYSVRTEKNIHQGEYTVENCAFMASRVRRYSIPDDIDLYKNILIGYLDACKNTDIFTLINSGRLPIGDELKFLCYMHYTGVINIEIDTRPLDYKSEVALCGK